MSNLKPKTTECVEAATMEQVLSRLDKMENKLDNIQAALVQMARTEERVVHLMEADNEKAKWLLKLQDQFTTLEKQLIESNGRETAEREARIKADRRTERGVWAVITGAISVIVGLVVAWLKGDGF